MKEKDHPTTAQNNTHEHKPKPTNDSSLIVLIIIMFLIALPFMILYFAAHFVSDASTDATATTESPTVSSTQLAIGMETPEIATAAIVPSTAFAKDTISDSLITHLTEGVARGCRDTSTLICASTNDTASPLDTTNPSVTNEKHDHSKVKTITDFSWDDDLDTKYLIRGQLDGEPGTIIANYSDIVDRSTSCTRSVVAIPKLPERLCEFIEDNNYHYILLYGEKLFENVSYYSTQLILYRSDFICNRSYLSYGNLCDISDASIIFWINEMFDFDNPDHGWHINGCIIYTDTDEHDIYRYAFSDYYSPYEASLIPDQLDQATFTSYTPTDAHIDQMLAKFAELQSAES